jgi:hypothetical protein
MTSTGFYFSRGLPLDDVGGLPCGLVQIKQPFGIQVDEIPNNQLRSAAAVPRQSGAR